MPRSSRPLFLRLAAVFAAGALLLLTVPGLEDARTRLAAASPGWVALLLAAELASCLAFVVAFRGVLAPRLPWRVNYRIAMAAQGTNVLLPSGGAGGLALAGWALRRTGMPMDRIARGTVALFLITSAVNFGVAVVAGVLLAVGALPGAVALPLAIGPAAAALVVIVAVALLPRLAGRFAALTRIGLADGVRDTGALLAGGRGAVIAGAIGYMTFDLAALAAAFAALGAVPPLGALLLAYVLGQLGGLIPVPGGVGGTDGGLIAALVVYGTPLTAAAAAVLAYRVFQLGVPALLGGLALSGLPRATERARERGGALAGACSA